MESRPLKNNLHTLNVLIFLCFKTLPCKNECYLEYTSIQYTSTYIVCIECRLQTLTIHSILTNIFFFLLTTCFLSRQKPLKESSSGTFSQITPPFPVFVKCVCITFCPMMVSSVQISASLQLEGTLKSTTTHVDAAASSLQQRRHQHEQFEVV